MEDGGQLQGGRKNFYLRWLGILYIVIRLDLRSLQILKGYPCLLFGELGLVAQLINRELMS